MQSDKEVHKKGHQKGGSEQGLAVSAAKDSRAPGPDLHRKEAKPSGWDSEDFPRELKRLCALPKTALSGRP